MFYCPITRSSFQLILGAVGDPSGLPKPDWMRREEAERGARAGGVSDQTVAGVRSRPGGGQAGVRAGQEDGGGRHQHQGGGGAEHPGAFWSEFYTINDDS